MKIFSASQIRAWDAYTIENEPVASLELMNRASQVFVNWFAKQYPDQERRVIVCCGTGNNGGDGLAVARMLHLANYEAKVLVCDFAGRHSTDFDAQISLNRKITRLDMVFCHTAQDFQDKWNVSAIENELCIDALFGSGLSRPLTGEWAAAIEFLNGSGADMVSIDLPSGLFCDLTSVGNAVIEANQTFSFERPKLAFFFPENASYTGDWLIESIGLHPAFDQQTTSDLFYLDDEHASCLILKRDKFAHKGSFGKALLICGSKGKIGAAVLAARGCLRSGAGLVTIHAPSCGLDILQTAVPEAMVSVDEHPDYLTMLPDLEGFTGIGVGPGIGQNDLTVGALSELISKFNKPMVLDADALNILSKNRRVLTKLPKGSILTPHVKEFERLFGKTDHDFERNELQRKFAVELGLFIILKGAHTAIACPDGTCWFNSTGNPGMATGGSGDVLTGILCGLLAQGYDPKTSCLLGVFLHGRAADIAILDMGMEALIAGDLPEYLGEAWISVQT